MYVQSNATVTVTPTNSMSSLTYILILVTVPSGSREQSVRTQVELHSNDIIAYYIKYTVLNTHSSALSNESMQASVPTPTSYVLQPFGSVYRLVGVAWWTT